jgi:hypothetical protein
MKLKLISMLAGAVVLVAPLTTMVALAQSHTPIQLFPALSGIQLTQEQQTQLAELRNQTRTSVENILTAEQRNQFLAALEQGQDFRSAITSLNLSPEQKTQLRGVFQSAQAQLANTITPEQRRQFLQNITSLRRQQSQ